MRVLVLHNPIAGRGRAAAWAATVRDTLAGAGHRVDGLETKLEPTDTWLDPALAEVDVLVVVGGDGAVRMACDSCARADTPLYHFPLGTENLFAREFGMDRSTPGLLSALERGTTRRVDLGRVDLGRGAGASFLLMASVGFDAEVIHDLAARRRGGISHLTYVGPIVRGLVRWRAPRLTVRVDGEVLVDGEPGSVIVANSRQYAGRLNPARRADMSDGRFDVVVFPVHSAWGLLPWAARCVGGRHLAHPRLWYAVGRDVVVECDPAGRFQIDGDRVDGSGPMSTLRFELRAAALPVLTP